ncbi:MAG: glycosyltransferase family 39 protein [Phototrophicaceae bacterium]
MPRTRQTSAQLLTFVALILGLQTLHAAFHFNRHYQLDEYWRVHAAIDQTPREITLQQVGDTNNPPLPRIIDSYWLILMGGHHSQHITRVVSVLVTLLGLACMSRITLDLFTSQAGLWVLFIYGTLPLVVFYGRDTGPYALLLTTTAMLTMVFVRWLHNRRPALMVIYAGIGCLAIYSHYFVVFVVIWHAAALLLLTDRQWRQVVYGFYTFAMIALALMLGWGLPLSQRFIVFSGVGLGHSLTLNQLTDMVRLLFNLANPMIYLPLLVGLFFAIRPQRSSLSSIERWGVQFLALGFVGGFCSVIAVHQVIPLVTLRNMAFLMVPLALLTGWIIAHEMPLPFRWAAIPIVLGVVITFQYRVFTIAPYDIDVRDTTLALNTYVRPDTRFIMEFITRNQVESIPLNYVIQRTLDYPFHSDDIFLMHQQAPSFVDTMNTPHFPAYESYYAENPIGFRDFTQQAEQIIWLSYQAQASGLGAILNQTHYLAQRDSVNYYWQEMYINVYERVPTRDEPYFRFNDTLTLENWRLADVNVNACEPVLIESWWQTEASLPANYNMSYSLIAADGGVALTDHGTLSNVLSLQWQPDEFYYDGRSITLPCDLPAGNYALVMTVYDPATAQPLEVAYLDGNAAPTDIYLTTLHVSLSTEGNP